MVHGTTAVRSDLDPIAMRVQAVSETPTSQGAVTRTAAVSRQTSPTGSACRDAAAAAAEAAAAATFGADPPGGGGGGGGGSSRADSRGGAAAWAAMLNGTSTCRSMPVVVCRDSSAACAACIRDVEHWFSRLHRQRDPAYLPKHTILHLLWLHRTDDAWFVQSLPKSTCRTDAVPSWVTS